MCVFAPLRKVVEQNLHNIPVHRFHRATEIPSWFSGLAALRKVQSKSVSPTPPWQHTCPSAPLGHKRHFHTLAWWTTLQGVWRLDLLVRLRSLETLIGTYRHCQIQRETLRTRSKIFMTVLLAFLKTSLKSMATRCVQICVSSANF